MSASMPQRREQPVAGEIRPPAKLLAHIQTADAITDLARDKSQEPGWFSSDLTRQVGLILAGDTVAVGATQKAGKTSFLLSQLNYLVTHGRKVLYFPLEMTPRQARQRWAASRLGLRWGTVAQGKWRDLPPDAMDALKVELERLKQLPAQFPDDKRATVGQVAGWTKWAIQEYQAEVVIVDHFHRLDVGQGSNYRVLASEAMRELKNLALEQGIRLLVAAQFNRSQHDRLDLVRVPDRGRFKETNAINEEADLTIGLSRVARRDAGKDDMKAVREGHAEIGTILEPGTMRVTVLDIRRGDLGDMRATYLKVTDQFVRDCYRGENSWIVTQRGGGE